MKTTESINKLSRKRYTENHKKNNIERLRKPDNKVENMGTFAPAFKMHFRNVQKFRKKYARVHIVVSSVRQKFRPKNTFYLTCVKKTKI